MYTVLVWDDATGDFVSARDVFTGKVLIFGDEGDAINFAAAKKNDGVQARVSYIRQQFRQKSKKARGIKTSRIQRIQTTFFDGERVRIVGVIDLGKGK